jgi:peptide/nickel transport system substrate-binding protein
VSRPIRYVGVLIGILLTAAACGGGDGGGDGDGDGQADTAAEITIAIGTEPSTLDPQIKDDGGERAVNDNVYETLVARTTEGELTPGLAAEMPTQLDETTWQFKLRTGITFHDGTPFNADAVVSSVQRLVTLGEESEQSGFFATITGAEKVDDTTVNVITSGPDPVLPTRMYWMKMIAPGDESRTDFAEKPNGTGPYTFVEWVRGDHVSLERNADYWGDEPAIARVTFRFIAEAGTRLSSLLAGEIDLMTNLLPEDVPQAPKSASVRGLEHPVIVLNARGGITADARVRQALNYAIDKEALANNLFGGLAVPDDCQVLSPTWFGYNGDLDPYPYDLGQAQSLIQEAGVAGQTIELVGESGRWLKDKETIEAVAQFWREAGLDVKVSIFEFGEYLNRLFDQENRPDTIFVSSSNELQDADRTMSTYYQEGGIGSSNSDPQLKALIDQARTEIDQARRQEMYEEATQIACDQAYFAFLLNNEDTYGMSENLEWQPRVDAKLLVKEMSVGS